MVENQNVESLILYYHSVIYDERYKETDIDILFRSSAIVGYPIIIICSSLVCLVNFRIDQQRTACAREKTNADTEKGNDKPPKKNPFLLLKRYIILKVVKIIWHLIYGVLSSTLAR